LSEIRIIGPDGQRFVFPSGTDPEVMKSAMRRRYTGETRRTTEMIRNTQLPDERMQGARDYLARDQLRQDIEAGRQSRRTEEATGPENVAQERFYTGAQGRTLGAAPLIQGAINIPISAMMYPFLTQEQKAGRSFDEFVSDMSSVGYDQARGSIERAREKRPLESLGLEIAGGFIAGKTAYDDLGNRFLASQPGARGALVGAGSGAQYEFLESEGDPLAAGRGALIGAPVGAGVSKAMEAAAEPLGRLFRGEVPVPKIGPDATNAIVGGTLGGIAPAETAEERAQNIALGAGLGAAARTGSKMLDDLTSTGAPRAMPDAMPAGAGDNPYFGRQSMRPPGSGPSAREIETQQQWATATPIVTQARTTALSAQQAADAALQSKAPADIARAKDQKKTLVGQIKEAQASRAGMDTPEDARLAETLASLTENTNDPVLLSTQISAAKTSLDRLLTDIGSPVEGNLIPVRTNILTRTQAPRSAAEGLQERPSVTRYAEGSDDVQPMGFGAGTPKAALPDYGYDEIKIGKASVEVTRVDDSMTINRLKVPENARGQGEASKALKEVLRQADEQGLTVFLTADPIGAGGMSKTQLEAFYKRNGFVPNKGRNKDFSSTAGMIRPPAFRTPPPIKGMGFGASTPKTPEQAVRFETPGSPEWEAAVAKGLDMSQAGRMGRREAWEANAHPDVKSSKWYHGTSKTDLTQLNRMPRGIKAKSDYSSEQGGMNRLGIWLSNRADEHGAEMYAGETGVIMPVVPRAKNPYVIQGSATPRAGQDKAFEEFYDFIRKLTPNAKGHPSMRDMEPVRKWLKENGYDSVILKNTYGDSPGLEKVPQDMLIVLDDGNIRSVNAAFDPEKSGSSTLLAAAPFAAVGGVGAGTAMGEDD
jgi:GNAT superfamily N-acetyltransferase